MQLERRGRCNVREPIEMQGQGIQSLELGIKILKTIGEVNKPLTITEISELCEIAKSKLHRYLTSFYRTGFLERDSNLRYYIGTELILLGLRASRNIEFIDKVKPTLLKISEELNETVSLSIWREQGPYCIYLEESNREVKIGLRVDAYSSVINTTAGRLFSAYLPERETKELIYAELIEKNMNPQEFENIILKVKRDGYSVTKETVVPGIVAVGCPLFSHDNKIVAVITITGILGVLDVSAHSHVVKFLKQTCSELTRML